ncbi:MAG: hypothetical protein JSV52_07735 [Candidatus Zixiibacteriota bacterium]|nr:MAG: hypothetical protein JSV52_07735 [candidate division Zixibacteria bacterium]
MDAGIGRIKAQLAEPTIERMTKLIQLINDNINPPTEVCEDDVHIRAMYIVSDEVNSFGGRFPADELGNLARLLVDSPVMVGHRKDRLPVARTFHAEIVTRENRPWVKSYFYWLKSSKGAEDLKDNIDGGIYKECSIGFSYIFPECSVCRGDIRRCRHEPFERYKAGTGEQVCHFNYRQIERVLETSLVYRGAVPDTAMSKELASDHPIAARREILISSPAELALDTTYLVVPLYESIPVIVNVDAQTLSVVDLDGNPISLACLEHTGPSELPPMENVFSHLVGYRGKERCSVEQLRKHLSGKSSSVTRVELKLIPDGNHPFDGFDPGTSDVPLRVIRHEYCAPVNLDEAAVRMKTKHGVRLWPVTVLPAEHGGFVYRPGNAARIGNGYYRFRLPGSGTEALLEFDFGGSVERFRIKQFHMQRFIKGGRFVADRVVGKVSPESIACESVICGTIGSGKADGDGIRLVLDDSLPGTIVIQAIELNRSSRYLIYHTSRLAE